MTEYYIAELGPTRARDLYISFRCAGYGGDVCWPLAWAGTWLEMDVVQAAAELNDGIETVAVPKEAVHALATEPAPGRINGEPGPVVRNSASNRRALVVAARRKIAHSDNFEIPSVMDAARS